MWAQRPPDRSLTNLIVARQLSHRFALGVTVGNHPFLARMEPVRTPELLALPLGPLNALLATLADQSALELGSMRCTAYQRAFLARRRGRGRTVVRKLRSAPVG
jgi:hypothetical protein